MGREVRPSGESVQTAHCTESEGFSEDEVNEVFQAVHRPPLFYFELSGSPETGLFFRVPFPVAGPARIFRRQFVETRLAVVSIIVENPDAVETLNAIIHDYRQYIIGRMGIPYQKHNISVISIVMDAPNEAISAFSGKLGMLPKVTIKTAYSRVLTDEAAQ